MFVFLFSFFNQQSVVRISESPLTSLNLQIDHTFVDITEVLNGSSISDNDIDLYWIAKGFYEVTQEISRDFAKLKDLTYMLLEKEDNAIFKYNSVTLPNNY